MNQTAAKTGYFTKKMFYRFFVPSVVSTVCLSFGNIVDALVVGARLGETGLAAIGLVSPIFMLYNVFNLGMAVGGSVCYSQRLGRGKATEAVDGFNRMFVVSLGFSVLIGGLGVLFLPQVLSVLGAGAPGTEYYAMAYSYLRILFIAAPLFFLNFLFYYYVRCDDGQSLAATGLIAGNAMDVALNVLFVLFLDMGVAGAIYATAIGKAVSVVIYLPHLLKRWTILRFKSVKPALKQTFSEFRVGFASSSQYLFSFVSILIMNNVLMRMAGKSGVAVFDVVMNVSFILLSLYEGTGSVLQPMCATFYGERNEAAQRRTLGISFKWGMILGMLAAAAAFVFARAICGVFGLDAATTAAFGEKAVRLFAVSCVFAGVSIMWNAYSQAVGRERFAFLISLLRNFAVYVLFILVFSSRGISDFWWVFPATEAVSLLVWLVLLALKRRAEHTLDRSRIYSRTISSADEDFSLLATEVEAFCERWSADMQQLYFVNLTVEEICQAILLNGFTGKGDEYIELTLIAEESGLFELHIRDNATEFNPLEMNKADLRDGDGDLSGLGITMIRGKAKEMFYRRYQSFNTLTVKV